MQPPFFSPTFRDVRRFMAATFLATIAGQMQSVAVGWQIYAATHRPLDLGLVGLAQFVPALLLSLVAGQVADRFDRKKVILIAACVEGICGLLLFALSRGPFLGPLPIYAVLFVLGMSHSFSGSAGQALSPSLVEAEHFPRAVAWKSSAWQSAMILGPALGGLLYGWSGGATAVYATSVGVLVIAILLLASLAPRPYVKDVGPVTKTALLAGIRYVREKREILGAISMDLFAVLLGGSVALLPAYASDILHVGPQGLGLLRAAPGLGAALTGLWLARFPLRRNAGRTMYLCVLIFGVATIVFGLSRSFYLSLACLFILGAADLVSVVIRQTLVQLLTPANLRGRVSAVNLVFVGASNELGEFESGLTAAWLGVIPSVVLGGIGTMVVVLLWTFVFPELFAMDRLSEGD